MDPLNHADFVAGYRSGNLMLHVDRKAAARFVSGRMLLPFILLPVFGLAVGITLAGWFIAGMAIFLTGFLFRWLVRSSSHGFVLTQSLYSAAFYRDALAAGVIRLESPPNSHRETGDPPATP
ncbi:MAG: hypothetical protein FJY43_02130 [Betaproteobacteria bacterium]|nr:hypothetical protein [Betaproteobacteria bacterium]